MDSKTTLQELKDIMEKFVRERELNQFHSPKNLSMAISVEASELMEKLIWIDSKASFDEVEKYREDIEHELADIITASFMFANACNIDVSDAIIKKMALNAKKYPVEKAKGRCEKYTQL